MDIKEFKAWFEGFSENIAVAPSVYQWARLRQAIKALDKDGQQGMSHPLWRTHEPPLTTFLNATLAGNGTAFPKTDVNTLACGQFSGTVTGRGEGKPLNVKSGTLAKYSKEFKPWSEGTFFGMDVDKDGEG